MSTDLDAAMAPHLAAVAEASAVADDLTVAQRCFLALHSKRLVERWQWHFMETQLRAHAGLHKATIWRDELADLITRGLIEKTWGFGYRITDAGRKKITA